MEVLDKANNWKSKPKMWKTQTQATERHGGATDLGKPMCRICNNAIWGVLVQRKG